MKFQRQAKILELIENNEIETQEDLSEKLGALGFETTQATVSRDIKELRIIKILADNGRYKYAVSTVDNENNFTMRLKKIFKECVINIDSAQNMVVIKTLPGLANAAAMALDTMKIPFLVGTLAGDDTVFIIMKTTEDADDFTKQAEEMLK